MSGKILIVCAPSGGGKGTIIGELKKIYGDSMKISVSCTSRNPRGSEQDGVDYYFIKHDEFVELNKQGFFAESNIYGNGKAYGTPAKAFEDSLESGSLCVLDIDVNGAAQIINRYYKDYPIVAIFLVPESLKELTIRLLRRNTETLDEIDKRIKTARLEYRKLLDGTEKLFDAIMLNASGRQHETAESVARLIESINEPRATKEVSNNEERRTDILKCEAW